jgi:hypothetical protein
MTRAIIPSRVPTLTEIVELADQRVDLQLPAAPLAEADLYVADAPLDRRRATAVPTDTMAPLLFGEPAIDAERLVAEVMLGVQQRIDAVFAERLRDALAPALARASEAVIAEARDALASGLREAVEKAVAQELARLRSR